MKDLIKTKKTYNFLLEIEKFNENGVVSKSGYKYHNQKYSPEIMQKMKAIAKIEGKSLSQLSSEILTDWVANYEQELE